MGLGSFDFSYRPDAEAAPLPVDYSHIHLYEGEQLVYTGVVLRTSRARRSFGGHGLDWWLGLDSDGPLIEDREYIAGTNKLSNGDFGDGDVLWRVDEDPMWAIAGGVASIVGTPEGAEILASDESFECEPGQLLRTEADVRRTTGTLGRLRVRTVFEGLFRHGNLLTGVGWTDFSPKPGDTYVSGGELILGPVTRRQVVLNYGFETGDLTNWLESDVGAFIVDNDVGDLGIPEGSYVVTLPAFGAGASRQLIGSPFYDVEPGEKLFLQGWLSPWAQDLSTHADGFAVIGAETLDFDTGAIVNFQTQTIGPDDAASPGWTVASHEFDVPDGHELITPYIRATEVTVGMWAFDTIIITHLERNKAWIEADAVPVRAGRTYRLLAPVTSDTSVKDGDIHAEIYLWSSDARDDLFVTSSRIGPTDGLEKLLSFDFTPPSGYHNASVRFVATDSPFGSWHVRLSGVSLHDTDERTKIESVSATTAGPGFTELGQDLVVPDGAERYRVEIEVEADGQGWQVNRVDTHRRETPDAAAVIVDDLLRDPDTNDYLIPAGTIHPAGTIAYDWRIRNQTDREALKHLSTSGLVGDAREWRVRPDPALDWGLPEEIFEDRTGFVLTEGALILKGERPDVVQDVSKRLTDIKLIGADRTPVGGQKQIITGTAAVTPDADEVDWFGNPLRRTRIVEDSTVDTAAFANGRAEIELDRNGTRADATRYQLADSRVAGQFDVGDWIYAYDPANGLEDPDNETADEGRTIWPVRLRVQTRTRKLGKRGSFKLIVRHTDGTLDDVTDLVDWEPETIADVQLGNLLPEFVVDPQGGAAGAQFRRYRATTGR